MKKFDCPCCQPSKSFKLKSSLVRHEQKHNPHYTKDLHPAEIAFNLNPQFCKQCGKILSYRDYIANKKVFCDRSCAAKHNNHLFPKRQRQERRRTVRYLSTRCLTCDSMLTNNQKKFCSKQCQHKSQNQKTLNRLLAGEGSSNKDGSLKKCIRQYLIMEAGFKCSSCGWDKIHPVLNKCPLQVDHIDGNSENNILSNLRVLCPNCHSLTTTFGGLNRGVGKSKLKEWRQAMRVAARDILLEKNDPLYLEHIINFGGFDEF